MFTTKEYIAIFIFAVGMILGFNEYKTALLIFTMTCVFFMCIYAIRSWNRGGDLVDSLKRSFMNDD